MKRLQMIILMLCLGVYLPSQAQFLKKLGKKVSDAAKNKVSDKSADKTSDEVGKGFDGIFSHHNKNGKQAPKPRGSYNFSYHYQMKVSSQMGGAKLDYFIDPGASYLGMAMNQRGMSMFMIFDYRKEATYSFISGKGRKMVTSQSLNTNHSNDWVNNDYNKSDYTITDLPDKTFLGYSCTGKQLENNEWKITIYYTDEVDFNMMNMFHANTGKRNESAAVLKKNLPGIEDSLMMYFKVIDKSDGAKSGEMTCTKLEKVDRNFDTDGYQAMN